jgi:hypothetical protein
MDRNQIPNELRVLGMTQQTAARLSRIPADRLSRFLGGNSSLRADEMSRIESVLTTCTQTENGTNDHLCESLPVDWSRVASSKELETAVFAAAE